MSVLTDLKASVETIVTSAWDHTDGRVVPDSTDLALGNHRVQMSAVVLYADLADSTELATTNQEIAAEVFKAYLQGATRLIRANGGEVRSFDGDRVMGVSSVNKETQAPRNVACRSIIFLRSSWYRVS